MDVMTRTCIIINNVHGDLCSRSVNGTAAEYKEGRGFLANKVKRRHR